MVGIVDKSVCLPAFPVTKSLKCDDTLFLHLLRVMGSLSSDKSRNEHNSSLHQSTGNDGVASLADGKPAETIVDDRIGGTHTRRHITPYKIEQRLI